MSFSLTFNTATPAGLGDLNAFLQSRSYVVGFTATQKDVELFNAIGKGPDAGKYPNVARYFSHIASLSADAKAKLPAGFGAGAAAAAAAPAAAAAKPAAAEEEDVDLFGDDADAAAAKVAAAAPQVEAAPAKKVKVPEISKSSCMYEIKPQEAGQDMKKMEDDLRKIEVRGLRAAGQREAPAAAAAVVVVGGGGRWRRGRHAPSRKTPTHSPPPVTPPQMDGLVWGSEFKVVDVAYGIQKLIVPLVIEDEKIGLEDLEEKMLSLEGDQVQSVDLLNMVRATGASRAHARARTCPPPRPRHAPACPGVCLTTTARASAAPPSVTPPVQNKVSGR
jgi:elongation factor 1-beta